MRDEWLFRRIPPSRPSRPRAPRAPRWERNPRLMPMPIVAFARHPVGRDRSAPPSPPPGAHLAGTRLRRGLDPIIKGSLGSEAVGAPGCVLGSTCPGLGVLGLGVGAPAP